MNRNTTSSSKASASLPRPLTDRPSDLKPALMPEKDGALNEGVRLSNLEGLRPSADSDPRGGLLSLEGKLKEGALKDGERPGNLGGLCPSADSDPRGGLLSLEGKLNDIFFGIILWRVLGNDAYCLIGSNCAV